MCSSIIIPEDDKRLSGNVSFLWPMKRKVKEVATFDLFIWILRPIPPYWSYQDTPDTLSWNCEFLLILKWHVPLISKEPLGFLKWKLNVKKRQKLSKPFFLSKSLSLGLYYEGSYIIHFYYLYMLKIMSYNQIFT